MKYQNFKTIELGSIKKFMRESVIMIKVMVGSKHMTLKTLLFRLSTS